MLNITAKIFHFYNRRTSSETQKSVPLVLLPLAFHIYNSKDVTTTLRKPRKLLLKKKKNCTPLPRNLKTV